MTRQKRSTASYINVLINPVTGKPTNLVYIVLGVVIIWIVYVSHYRGEPPVSNPKLDLGDDKDVAIDERHLGDRKKSEFDPDLIPFQHLLHPQRSGDKAVVEPDVNKDTLQKEDNSVPLSRRNIPRPHPKNFPVDILHRPSMFNAAKCPLTTFMLVVVMSLPADVKMRNAIRRTWSGPQNFGEIKISGLTWRTIFAIGSGDEEENKKISEESKIYGDVLQGEFDDTGVEDTRKTMMAFKWITGELLIHEGCRPAFVMNAPTKIYIHMPFVLDWIAHKVKHLQNVYRGKILRKDNPIRNEQDPLYVSPEDYAGDIFPDMIRNPVFLFSTDVVEGMVERFSKITPIAMEDSYLGILANDMGIKPVDDEHFLLMQRPRNVCSYRKMMFVYEIAPAEQIHVFNVVERGHLADACLEEDRGL